MPEVKIPSIQRVEDSPLHPARIDLAELEWRNQSRG